MLRLPEFCAAVPQSAHLFATRQPSRRQPHVNVSREAAADARLNGSLKSSNATERSCLNVVAIERQNGIEYCRSGSGHWSHAIASPAADQCRSKITARPWR
jgi:hypothetical protein